jgi:hypothetical protein
MPCICGLEFVFFSFSCFCSLVLGMKLIVGFGRVVVKVVWLGERNEARLYIRHVGASN